MARPATSSRARWLGLTLTCTLAVLAWQPLDKTSRKPSATDEPWACVETAGQTISWPLPSSPYNQPINASIYLPPCYDWTPGQLPVIYLLHGAMTDETQWPDLQVQQDADALIARGAQPFIVVMPGGAYVVNVDYEAFVLNDLIPAVEGRWRVSRAANQRAIGGISLGGYWALKSAFQRPDLFAAVGGHSPVVTRGGTDDPSALAVTDESLAGLNITLDAGQDDSLRTSTQQFAAVLQGRGLSVTLTISPGGHDRPYWRSHTADYLRFYLAALKALPCVPCPD